MDYLSYLETQLFTPLGMATASFGEDAATNPKLLKLYAYGPNEMEGTKFDLAAPKLGSPVYKTAESGNMVECGSTLPPEMHFDHCKRSEYIQAVKAKKAPIHGDAGMTGTAGDYFKFMCAGPGRNRYEVQGGHLNPLGLFLCASIPRIWSILSAFLPS